MYNCSHVRSDGFLERIDGFTERNDGVTERIDSYGKRNDGFPARIDSFTERMCCGCLAAEEATKAKVTELHDASARDEYISWLDVCPKITQVYT